MDEDVRKVCFVKNKANVRGLRVEKCAFAGTKEVSSMRSCPD